MSGTCDDRPRAGLLTRATRLVARAPLAPQTLYAVHSAHESIALLGSFEEWACYTTVVRLDLDGTFAGSRACTTSLGAGSVSTPKRHLAITWAFMQVAVFGLCQDRASLATMGGLAGDSTSVCARANAARFRACGPCSPCSHRAVNGASLGIALLLRFEFGAEFAAMSRSGSHRTGASLFAFATRLGARGPGRPSTNDTVDGTSESIARL